MNFENLIKFIITFWFWFALFISFFWGIRGVILFSQKGFWWKSYQFLFNFIGSFAGWGCFYVLLARIQNSMPSYEHIGTVDIVIFFIAMLGLTGHLPQSIYGLVEGFAELAKKASEKVK